jgi:hypothetical protein
MAWVSAAVVVAAAVSLPSPAHAAEVSTSCSPPGRAQHLDAWAYYTPEGAVDSWYEFRYLLSNTGSGRKNNVNIWLYESPAPYFVGENLRWQYFSPDSLVGGVTYTTRPGAPVTFAAENLEWAEFEAVFDKSWTDPRCRRITPPV